VFVHWFPHIFHFRSGPIERWKPDISVVRATIQFAKDTGRLQTIEQETASADSFEFLHQSIDGVFTYEKRRLRVIFLENIFEKKHFFFGRTL
jgi:hypothetical protein